MAERPKFRRKKRPRIDDPAGVLAQRTPDADGAPVPPLLSRQERLARRTAEQRVAQDAPARQAEQQRLTEDAMQRAAQARAEAKRRTQADQTAQELAQADSDTRKNRLAAEKARIAEISRRAAKQRAAEKQRAAVAAHREAPAQDDADGRAETDAQDATRHAADLTTRRDAEDAARAQAEAEAQAEHEARHLARQEADARARARATAEAEAEAVARLRAEQAEAQPLNMTAPMRQPAPVQPTTEDAWAQLGEFTLDERVLERNRIITAGRNDPAHAAFDVLRTRLLQALAERGWSRVAITSPTKGCGKTFTAANLAISLARQDNCGTLLLDMDMRAPSLHKVFGQTDPGSMGDMLRGRVEPVQHLLRPAANGINVGRHIAFGFNGIREDYASELLQDPTTAAVLSQMHDRLKPNIVLYDMPPALSSDDVIAFRAQYDAVLLVVGGGLTTDSEIKEVERRLGDQTPLLGMVLNRAEGVSSAKYAY